MKHWLKDIPCHKQRDVIFVDEYRSYGESVRKTRNSLRKAKDRGGAKVYTEVRPLYNIVRHFNG